MSLSVRAANDGGLRVRLPYLDGLVLRTLPGRLERLLADPKANRRVVGRLFPRAYRDPEKDAEYRRLLGEDMLARKRGGLDAFRRSLAAWKPRGLHVDVRVPPDVVEDWLCFVNDMRLVLGMELEIEEDGWSDDVDPDDPRAPELALLHYLSYLQDKLIRAIG